jgi:hypothetical protein
LKCLAQGWLCHHQQQQLAAYFVKAVAVHSVGGHSNTCQGCTHVPQVVSALGMHQMIVD